MTRTRPVDYQSLRMGTVRTIPVAFSMFAGDWPGPLYSASDNEPFPLSDMNI